MEEKVFLQRSARPQRLKAGSNKAFTAALNRCASQKQGQWHPFKAWLLELRVFGLGLLKKREIGVGVFPEGEKILVGGSGAGGVSG